MTAQRRYAAGCVKLSPERTQMPPLAAHDIADLVQRASQHQPADLRELRTAIGDRIATALDALRPYLTAWEKREITQAFRWLTFNLAYDSTAFLMLSIGHLQKAFTPIEARAAASDPEIDQLTYDQLRSQVSLVKSLIARR